MTAADRNHTAPVDIIANELRVQSGRICTDAVPFGARAEDIITKLNAAGYDVVLRTTDTPTDTPTTTLVARLRRAATDLSTGFDEYPYDVIIEAADRLEKLQAAIAAHREANTSNCNNLACEKGCGHDLRLYAVLDEA